MSRSARALLLPLSALVLLAGLPAEASFGGKIKNIRIRERNNSQGYRVVVVVKDDESALIGGFGLGELVAGPLDLVVGTGDAAVPSTVAGPRSARATFALDGLDAVAADGAVPAVELQLCTAADVTKAQDAGGGTGAAGVGRCVGTASLAPVTVPLDGAEHAFSVKTPSGAELALSAQGTGPGIKIDISSVGLRIDGGELGIDELAGIDMTAASGSKLVLDGGSSPTVASPTLRSVRTRYVQTVGAAAVGAEQTAAVSATLVDADGTALDRLVRTVAVDDAVADAGIWSSRLSLTRKGKLRHAVRTVTSSPDAVVSVDALVHDAATGEQLLTSVDDAPQRRSRLFTAPVDFDGDPTGLPLSLTLAPLGESGGLVTEAPLTVTLLPGVEAEVEASCCTRVAALLAPTASPTTWELQIGVGGEEVVSVDAVEAQFNEPFEGPTPQSTVLSAGLALEVQTWVATTRLPEGAGTAGYEVDVQLLDGEGAVKELLSWDGGVDERATGNGKGTRTVATQSSTTPPLL